MHKNNVRPKRKKLEKTIEKVFRNGKPGDKIAFLTEKEEGGIFIITKREGLPGPDGTIILTLQNKLGAQIHLDMRRDGPNIVTMHRLKPPNAPTAREKPASEQSGDADSASPGEPLKNS